MSLRAIKYLLLALLITALRPTLVLGQITTFDYWDILPTEPRVRWSPSQNPKLLTDWQIQYDLGQLNVRFGGIRIDPEANVWQRGQKQGRCYILRSNVVYDLSEYKNCQVDLTDKQRQGPLVKLNGRAVGNRGTLLLSQNQKITAEFIFPSFNRILTIQIQAPQVDAVDISYENQKWVLLLQNQNFKPIDLGLFDPTFPFKEKLFSVTISEDESFFTLPGFLGVKYGRLLETPDNPKAFSTRPQIKTKRDLITYKKNIRIPVQTDPTDPNSIEQWETSDLKKNEWNEVIHSVGDTKMSYFALRMPQYEASIRFSMVKAGAAATIVPNGEFAILGFSENLFSSNYDSFFNHRFGWRLRGWQSLDTSNPLYDLKLTQGELRLLLGRGVWNIEQTWGLLAAGYQFEYFNFPVTTPGVGFFWGRSLPNVVDRLFRWSSWFKFPKYTDLDFTYIPPHHPRADYSYVMNFHGKMFLPNQTFFEAGISFYQFSNFDEVRRSKRTLEAVAGTVGFGYMF